jgi:hypothetical protein
MATKRKNRPAPVKAGPPTSPVASAGKATAGAISKANRVLSTPGAEIGKGIHAADENLAKTVAGNVKTEVRGAEVVGHTINEEIGAPIQRGLGYLFRTPAQQPTNKPKVDRGVPASLVPHPSPSKGTSALAQHVVNATSHTAVQSGTPSTATPPANTAGGNGLPAPSPLNPTTADEVLNVGDSANQAQLAIGTLTEFGMTPAMATQIESDTQKWQAQGLTQEQMQPLMYQTSWFKQLFPGITQQLAAGLTPVTPAQYMSDYQNVQQTISGFGINPAVLTPAMYGQLTGTGLSAEQITGRLGLAFNQAGADLQHNPGAVALLSQHYGVAPNPSAIAAFYMTGDPASGANVAGNLGNITAAAVGGAAAQNQGFSKLGWNDLLSMTNQGVSATQLANASAQQASDLSATEKGVASGNAPTVTETELLQAGQGVPGTTVEGVNAEQAQRQTNLAVGGKVSAFKGGGGFAGSGQPGAPTGTGYGEQ